VTWAQLPFKFRLDLKLASVIGLGYRPTIGPRSVSMLAEVTFNKKLISKWDGFNQKSDPGFESGLPHLAESGCLPPSPPKCSDQSFRHLWWKAAMVILWDMLIKSPKMSYSTIIWRGKWKSDPESVSGTE